MWYVFAVLVIVLMALDLGVFHRKAHAVKFKEALGWSFVWVLLALLFNVGVYMTRGPEDGMRFLTGYVIEYALSVDNIFVFLMVFSYFQVPAAYQHKILFWGILGAVLMRAVFIGLGVAVLHRFEWVMYIFGVFLVFTGIKMALKQEDDMHIEKNPALRLLKKFIPLTHDASSGRFFIREGAKWVATPLFVTLVVVELTDLVFAVDSIPAILAISQDPFIVYTSNIFAILGLRSLFFALAGMMGLFRFLKYGLSFILVFVGSKMLVVHYVEIPVALSLGVIIAILAASVGLSLAFPKKETNSPNTPA